MELEYKKREDFSEYKTDVDIPNSVFNYYLKKYSDRYRLEFDSDNQWIIKCKFGKIYPHSLIYGFLAYTGSYYSKTKKTYALKKLKGLNYELIQDGDYEFTIKFLEDDIEKFENALMIKKKKKISDESKKKLVVVLRKARERRLNKNE